LGLFGRRLAVDASRRHLLVVDLPRFLREARTDVLGLGLDFGAQLAHGRRELAMGRHPLRLGFRRLDGRRCLRDLPRPLALAARDHAGCHQRLRHLARAAVRTGKQVALRLLVEGGAIGEPGLELVTLLALETVANHDAALALMAEAWATWKDRSCSSDGTRPRASRTWLTSMSATITPGVS